MESNKRFSYSEALEIMSNPVGRSAEEMALAYQAIKRQKRTLEKPAKARKTELYDGVKLDTFGDAPRVLVLVNGSKIVKTFESDEGSRGRGLGEGTARFKLLAYLAKDKIARENVEAGKWVPRALTSTKR